MPAKQKKTRKPKPVTFVSERPNIAPVVEPSRPARLDPVTRVVIEPAFPGKRIQFQEYPFGRKSQFDSHGIGKYETSDPEEIKFLKEHELFGNPVGWWEEGEAPTEPRPSRKTVRRELTEAVAADDLGALETLLENERASHNRKELVTELEDAIETLEDRRLEPVSIDAEAEAEANVPNEQAAAEAATSKKAKASGDSRKSSD